MTDGPLFLMRWTERRDRSPRLDPVDGRDLLALAAAAVRAAAAIRFVDPQGKASADWSELLLGDATLLAAVIATHDLRAARAEVDAACAALHDLSAPAGEADVAWRPLDALLAEIERWRRLAVLGAPRATAAKLSAELARTLEADLAPLSAVRARARRRHAAGPLGGRAALAEDVRQGADLFEQAFERLRPRAGALAEEGLRHASHRAAPTLHLVLAELQAAMQAELNALPSRIAAFHREHILHEPLRPALMDSVRLVLSLPPGSPGAVVPSGARFAADDQTVYAADHALEITAARLGRVRMVRRVEAQGRLARVLETEFACPAAGVFEPALPVFGGREPGDLGGATRSASLGFGLSCPELRSRGLARQVRIRLHLNGEAKGIDWGRALELRLRTVQGWAPPPDVACSTDDGDLELAFDLPDTFVVPAPSELEADGAEAAQPLLAVRLADGASEDDLNALVRLRVVAVTASVTARLDDLEVRTPGGPSPPLNLKPFGAPARKGARFELRHPDLADKALREVSLDLRWSDLPTQAYGFADYYAQYVIGLDRALSPKLFDNDVFQARARLTGGGLKLTPEAERPFPLFRTYEEAGEAVAQQLLVPDVRHTFEVEEDLGGRDREGDPRLTVTLSAPDYGFGEDLYVPNLLHASQAGLSQRRSWLSGLVERISPERRPSTPALAHPNRPWTPVVQRLSLTYRAVRRFDLRDAAADGRLRLCSLLPFERFADVEEDEAGLPFVRVPASRLDLELTGLAPGERHQLLMLLGEPVGTHARLQAAPRLDWSSQDGVMRELTGGPEHEGVLAFHHRPDRSLPVAWVSGTAPRDAEYEPILRHVAAHTLSATRVDGPGGGPHAPLPAGTIKAFAGRAPRPTPVVEQPWPSTGGRLAETSLPSGADGRVDPWLAERSRHRGRAETAWDYERLTLDLGMAVARVRALEASGAPGRPAGTVTVVVQGDGGRSLSLEERLALRDRLSALSSPAAEVRVVDPVEVTVRVTAEVAFTREGGTAALAQDIGRWLGAASDTPDAHGRGSLTRALHAFVDSRAYVAGVGTLAVELDPAESSTDWAVPVPAGTHAILDVSPL